MLKFLKVRINLEVKGDPTDMDDLKEQGNRQCTGTSQLMFNPAWTVMKLPDGTVGSPNTPYFVRHDPDQRGCAFGVNRYYFAYWSYYGDWSKAKEQKAIDVFSKSETIRICGKSYDD